MCKCKKRLRESITGPAHPVLLKGHISCVNDDGDDDEDRTVTRVMVMKITRRRMTDFLSNAVRNGFLFLFLFLLCYSALRLKIAPADLKGLKGFTSSIGSYDLCFVSDLHSILHRLPPYNLVAAEQLDGKVNIQNHRQAANHLSKSLHALSLSTLCV